MRARSPLTDQAQALLHYKSLMRSKTSLNLFTLILIGFCTFFSLSSVRAEDPLKVIEGALDPYLTNVQYRDVEETILYKEGRAEVWLLESLEQGDLSKKICDGVRWLLGGRLKRSLGARDAFMKLAELRELSLIFYKVKTRVNPNLEGQYLQQRSPMPVARFTISKERAMMLHSERVLTLLQGTQCESQARDLLDDLWISPDVMKSRERLKAIQAQRFKQQHVPTTKTP